MAAVKKEKKEKIILSLTASMLGQLDERAARSGESRQAVIRALLARGLEKKSRKRS
jgi:metal-responsive CopG/Arc/MetJ family transcriptional regulator